MTIDRTPTPAPWARQPGESAKAFAAFVVYRDQQTGDRSLRDVAQTCSKSDALIMRWSREKAWVARVTAWDAELDKQHRQTLVRRRRLARERHLAMAEAGFDRAATEIKKLLDAGAFKPSDAIRLFEVSARLERDVLGEVQAIDVTTGGQPLPPAVQQTVFVADLSVAEAREELTKLRAEIDRRLTTEPLDDQRPPVLLPVADLDPDPAA